MTDGPTPAGPATGHQDVTAEPATGYPAVPREPGRAA
jgi:hypothetical protein